MGKSNCTVSSMGEGTTLSHARDSVGERTMDKVIVQKGVGYSGQDQCRWCQSWVPPTKGWWGNKTPGICLMHGWEVCGDDVCDDFWRAVI